MCDSIEAPAAKLIPALNLNETKNASGFSYTKIEQIRQSEIDNYTIPYTQLTAATKEKKMAQTASGRNFEENQNGLLESEILNEYKNMKHHTMLDYAHNGSERNDPSSHTQIASNQFLSNNELNNIITSSQTHPNALTA